MRYWVGIVVSLIFTVTSHVAMATGTLETNTVKQKPAKKLSFVLVSPTSNDEGFWGDVHNFARASANDLDVDFSVVYNASHHGLTYLEIMEALLRSPKRPDAILAVSYRRRTKKILALSVKYKIPIFLINNSLPHESREAIGLPRVNYPTYLGHMSANDYDLSKQLTKVLVAQAKKDLPTQVVNVVGISGSRDAPETFNRNMGLRGVIEQDPMARLFQVVHADWQGAEALRKTTALIKRYKNIHVAWYASDLMALHSAKAWNSPLEKHVVSGGFDWTKEAIAAIKQGKLDATAGGHFTDAGFAVVLLHDYFHGKDFAEVFPLVSFSSGGVIHRANVDKYYELLVNKDWDGIDFKKYSRVYYPSQPSYDFSIERLLND
ncbi:hypothetical protein CW748_09305 [Alteromonadales bacterium alter-6D02]|nr:hypothetical protein CW748_09305 [Alteromonadales bacterium alter-6D02]